MRTLELTQHSPEWLQHRATHKNSSEAPAMMGMSAKVRRSELLRVKAGGADREFSAWVTEVLFAKGHEVEALARPFAEEIIGEELFPAVGESDDFPDLGASFDGITMDESICWECKQWNEAKAAEVRAGRVPVEDLWQCVQQLVVSGAQKLLYMVSDGTKANTVHCWLLPDPNRTKALLDGWKQFDADLAAYTPSAPAAEVVPAPVSQLPAIVYKLNGLALTSNLADYKAAAQRLVEDSRKPLQTDQDFADREALNKAFKDAEDRIEVVRGQVIAEIKDVDQFSRELGEIGELIRQARLNGEKQVKARKEAIRAEIHAAGSRAFLDHVAVINKRLGKVSLPPLSANFAEAMKGKKTLASLKDAVDTELARAKIEANALAEKIDANLKTVQELGADHQFLFADLQQLVMKDTGDLAVIVKSRIADHKAKLEREAEAQRERIREEERRKLAAQAPPPPAPPAAAPARIPAAAKPRMRADGPTAAQVVSLVATHYSVTEAVARGWLVRHFAGEQQCAA